MQVLKEFESVVSLPKKRSRISKENGYYFEKKLSEAQKFLLGLRDNDTAFKDRVHTAGNMYRKQFKNDNYGKGA